MKVQVARDKYGLLVMGTIVSHPYQDPNRWCGQIIKEEPQFKDIKFEDGPVDVYLVTKQELENVIDKSSKGISEDIDGEFYIIYDKKNIVKQICK